MRKIYRVEVPTHYGWKGPYAFKHDITNVALRHYMLTIFDNHSWCSCHPGPKQEGYQSATLQSDLFGFSSSKQMIKWFGGYLPKPIRLGARIKIYNVPSENVLFESDKQLLFRLNNDYRGTGV